MQIRILGPVDALGDDGPLELGGRKQRTLVALLASHLGSVVSVDRCIDALWGESAPEGAIRSLQTYVSNLRRLLDPERSGVIDGSPNGYQLNAGDGITVDAAHFEDLIGSGAAEPTDRAERLEEALDLWRGHPLGDIADDDWARGLLAHWEQLQLQALADLARVRLELGDPETVVAAMEGQIEAHPFHEVFWARYMTALYQLGRQADALRAYSRLRELLGEELGLEPSVELADLEEQILLQDPQLERPTTTPHNLPADLSNLIGRDKDISEVAGLFAEARLVTLVGSGGVGKTRLGIAAADASLARYPDGVWFVDLAPLADADVVLPTVAQVIGVEPPALRPLADALVDTIGDRRMLFILDNCEHLADAAAAAAAILLQRTPRVDVLATSREVLQLRGETAWRVPSLPVPDIASTDPVLVGDSDSVALFVARAHATDASFLLQTGNAAAVAAVCRHVDGIPLAIELAAARVRTLSAADLEQRLGETFDVLSGGGREVLARHRTLRATIEWSHGLLGEEAQALFNCLGVFAGSFTLEGAVAVARGEERRTADLVDELVSKSMLVSVPGLRRRFRLLEVLRQYAVERLEDTDVRDSARDAHLEWVVAMCRSETPKLMTGEQLETLSELHTDIDDLRAALRWSVDSGRPEIGLRIATSLARFWYLAAMHQEGASWFDELLETEPDLSDLEMGRALTAAALALVRIGRIDEAAEYVREAVRLLEPLDEPQALGWAYFYLAITTVEETYTNIDDVEAGWKASRASFAEAGYAPGVGLATLLLTAIELMRDPRGALNQIEDLIAKAEAAGNANMSAHSHEFLARAKRDTEELDDVARALQRAIELHVEVGNWACLAHCIEGGVGAYLVARDREQDAARIVGGTDAMRLNLSTVEAPYERFVTDFYTWVKAIGQRSELVAAREEGLSWDRDQLIVRALDYVKLT